MNASQRLQTSDVESVVDSDSSEDGTATALLVGTLKLAIAAMPEAPDPTQVAKHLKALLFLARTDPDQFATGMSMYHLGISDATTSW